jgi:hypothetical protein
LSRRGRWLSEIAELIEMMVWETSTAMSRRCGRASCHCASGEKHGPIDYLSRNESGRTRNIFVPEEFREQVETGVTTYRRYRELGQEMGMSRSLLN